MIDFMFSDIVDFHEKFKLEKEGEGVVSLPEDVADFRMRCACEEAEEIFGANKTLLEAKTPEEETAARAELLDGVVDLLYFAIGTVYLHGINEFQFNEAWDRVHRQNMKKVRAQADGSDSKRNHGADVVKGPGWTPADLTDLVR